MLLWILSVTWTVITSHLSALYVHFSQFFCFCLVDCCYFRWPIHLSAICHSFSCHFNLWNGKCIEQDSCIRIDSLLIAWCILNAPKLNWRWHKCNNRTAFMRLMFGAHLWCPTICAFNSSLNALKNCQFNTITWNQNNCNGNSAHEHFLLE